MLPGPTAAETATGSTASTTPAATPAPAAAPADFVTDHVQKAISQVKNAGQGAATESAPSQDPAPKESAAAEGTTAKTEPKEEPKSQDKPEEPKKATPEQPGLYTPDELKKVKDVFDIDPDRYPEELRPFLRKAQRAITKGFQDLAAERKNAPAGSTETAVKDTEKQPTRSADEKTITDEELYEMALESPAGLRKAFQTFVSQEVKPALKAQKSEEESQQREQMEARSKLTADAIDVVTEQFPELETREFQALVAKEIESDKRLAKVVAHSDDEDAIQLAITTAAERAKAKASAQKPEPKPDPKEEDRKRREKLNAEEKGPMASRKGSQTTVVDDGPMTVEKSIRLAKNQLAAGR